jgi:hypothetical protein
MPSRRSGAAPSAQVRMTPRQPKPAESLGSQNPACGHSDTTPQVVKAVAFVEDQDQLRKEKRSQRGVTLTPRPEPNGATGPALASVLGSLLTTVRGGARPKREGQRPALRGNQAARRRGSAGRGGVLRRAQGGVLRAKRAIRSGSCCSTRRSCEPSGLPAGKSRRRQRGSKSAQQQTGKSGTPS